MEERFFTEKVAEWYAQYKRNLPWRLTNDPYKIWLSEIILQQTRVNQGLPYYHQFIEKYPNVAALANAAEQDVLRMWQGLGYYTRARNLHKCAKQVMEKHSGTFPRQYVELLTLPGIGEYTAAAIASISSKEPVAVVDGNVFRVLARTFGIEQEINSPEGKRVFSTLANKLINKQSPDVHNQAVMEFGALWCTPKSPRCEECILQTMCFAYKHGLQEKLPVKIKAKAARRRYFYYFILQHKNALLMRQRGEKDIWHGLYDFYLVETTRATKPDLLIKNDVLLKSMRFQKEEIFISAQYKHVLSHQIILSRFILVKPSVEVKTLPEGFKFYSFKKISELPKPVLISRFLEDIERKG